jgi:hypothetical protein
VNHVTPIFVLLAALMTGACGTVDSPVARTKFAPADKSAYNVAFLVGSPNDLPGVKRDITEVSRLIREGNMGYDVVALERATVSQVMAKAQEIGQKLSANSTVFFYFSGHGSESGYLFAQGYDTFQMSQVAKQIGAGYGKGTFKRFIAVMDSCFSGQNVDGQKSMFLAGSSGSSTQTTKSTQEILESAVSSVASDVSLRKSGALPFEQALVVGASLRNQTADDFGSSIGGAFTHSWRKAFGKGLKGRGTTIRQVLGEAKTLTRRNTGGSQTPVWRAIPESLLDEMVDAESGALPLAKDIFAAMGGSSNGSLMFASIPASAQVASIDLCRGDKVACMSGAGSQVGRLLAAPTLKVNGRSIFRSEQYVNIQNGETLTLVLRGDNGTAIEARSMRARVK